MDHCPGAQGTQMDASVSAQDEQRDGGVPRGGSHAAAAAAAVEAARRCSQFMPIALTLSAE